jgi:formate dehydrogenase major subunit
MGITQHTVGGQNVKSFAVLQTLMGNMGRAGGGINALRGIHNVQGSTDMGLLYGNIPAYSANPTAYRTGAPSPNANAFGAYVNALWGTPLSGTSGTTNFTGSVRANMNGSYDDAYDVRAMALQQRGFYNMTLKFFGGYSQAMAATDLATRRNIVDNIYDLWPKGQGDNHIVMFRNMGKMDPDPTRVKACVVWGQNPAVTEPYQGKVRAGLKNLDTLVCVDMFANETALVDRKVDGVTYLIPACSHVEHAGSATNSGRTLQWRYRATTPKGNSKDDIELLLRFAYALDGAGAFSHIAAKHATLGIGGGVYANLYGTPYGWTPGTAFESVVGTGEKVNMRAFVDSPVTYDTSANNLTGAEWVAELVYREMAAPSGSGGTIWIYTGAFNNGATWATDNKASGQANWAVQNRAKSRDNANDSNIFAYHGWGYAWLVNRRVLYNNSEIPGDVADFFMGPDSCSRLFVSTNTAVLNYSRWYRTIHRLADKPDVVLAGTTSSPHFVTDPSNPLLKISYAGRFPAHCEPYESPKAAFLTAWGRNTKGTATYDLVPGDTPVAGRDVAASGFPLILTTIRCVEHFQGGPTTRNNSLNVEVEPEPWIEIHSADARTYGITDGDWVNIITARGDSQGSQTAITPNYTSTGSVTDNFGKGFRARVGVGVDTNQRVAKGVVAIPWHWGDAGLSTGARANDLCIDAMDANTTIPESKACLCKIEKAL